MSSPFVLDLAAIKARQATLNMGTLGNVSEGKSTFVRSISGVTTQKHQKEKQTNITIHLGYAGFKIWRHTETGDLVSTGSAAALPSAEHELVAHYSFVDCPGHEAYLATMLSGAAIMDAAALLIASNSPTIPQIQTEEHLMAAEFMGLPHVFTIQNKLDLVSDPAVSLEKIRGFVSGTVAESAPIIPMSAQRGWGVEHALHHLTYALPEPERSYNGPLKMMIVRSFDINKPLSWTPTSAIAGGVVGGTILSGVLQKDDIVEIRPGLWKDGVAYPILTRVKSLYCDTTELPLAIAGGLIGVGTTLDPALTAANGLAGQIVGTPGTLPPITMKLRGAFRAFRRSGETKLPKQAEGDHISFCVGIMTVKGKISKIVDKHTRVIKLVAPVCVSKGQICGILRSNGARDLLDGVFVVESVQPFERVEAWVPELADVAEAEKTRVLARRYTVLAHDVRKEAEPLPSYQRMLESIESLAESAGAEKTKLHLPGPEVGRLPKKSVWTNSVAFFDALKKVTPDATESVPLEEHFQEFLMRELATTLTVKGDGQYLIKGRFNENNMRSMISKYLKKFHMCKQCGALETSLMRQDKVHKILCSKCTSYSLAEIE